MVEESNLSSVWIMELNFFTIIQFEMDLFVHCIDGYTPLSLLRPRTCRHGAEVHFPLTALPFHGG